MYAYNYSGYNPEGTNTDGFHAFSTSTSHGLIERKLYFCSYSQDAFSYNSENIALPVGTERVVRAKVDRSTGHHVVCHVKVIGFKRPSA